MICLDTHALLWWALDPPRLSPRARELCAQMERDGGHASAISIWELGLKIKSGDLEIGISIEDFAARVARTGIVEIVPVTAEIWMENLALEWGHRDPADRTIVATARRFGVPLLTKDREIRRWKPAGAVW